MVFDRMDDRPAFVGIPTFLHVPELRSPEDLQREQPDVAIVGAPTDTATTHRPGARFGPRAIRQASNLRRAAYHLDLHVQPFQLLRVFDYGDGEVAPADIELPNDAIRPKVGEVARAGA